MKETMKRVVIEFTASEGLYNAGDVAGFSPEVSQKIVEGGKAFYYEEPKDDKPAKTRAKLDD